jgi:hypothetical protein
MLFFIINIYDASKIGTRLYKYDGLKNYTYKSTVRTEPLRVEKKSLSLSRFIVSDDVTALSSAPNVVLYTMFGSRLACHRVAHDVLPWSACMPMSE